MKLLTDLFFFGYAGLLTVAGGWGVLGARRDHRSLLGVDLSALSPRTAASVLSQYRFLRAIEFGFGVFALVFRREIYTELPFNRVFLAAMLLGVLARIVSLVADGKPRGIFYAFLVSEGIGFVLIFIHTRGTLVSA
jgi:hypothetical protein